MPNISEKISSALDNHPALEKTALTSAKAGCYVVMVAGIITPPITGAVIGFEEPVTTVFAPGISATTQAEIGDTSNVAFGTPGSVNLPQVHGDIKFKHISFTQVAGEITVNPLNPDLSDPDSAGIYTALLRDPKNTIQKPIVAEVERHTVEGLEDGAALEVLLAIAGLATAIRINNRRFHADQAKNQKITTAVTDYHAKLIRRRVRPSLITDFEDVKSVVAPEPRETHPWRRKIVAASLALATVAAGLAIDSHELKYSHPAISATTQPLNPELVKLKPGILKRATVSDVGAQIIINRGSEFLLEQKAEVDSDDQTINRNILVALDKLRQQGGLTYLSDRNYTITAHISDEHCNIANMSQILPVVLHNFNVSLVINTGDTDVSTGTLPFENDCVSVLAKAMRPTKSFPGRIMMVTVRGNHDGVKTVQQMRSTKITDTDGKSYDPFVVLDSTDHNQATIDGIPFVGSTDERQSVAGTPIQPSDPAAQLKLLASQGHNLVPVACNFLKQSGVAPVELTHDPVAGYASMLKGCVSLALSGHLHTQHPIYATIGENRRIVYTFNQGTSSGAGENSITEYAAPHKDAPITMFVFDNQTHQPVGYYNLVIHPDLTVSLSGFQPMPATEATPTGVTQFVANNDPSDLPPVTQPSNGPTPKRQHRHQGSFPRHTKRQIGRASQHGRHHVSSR